MSIVESSRPLSLAWVAIGALALAACGGGTPSADLTSGRDVAAGEDPVHRLAFESEEFVIGRRIDSMDGPSGIQVVELRDTAADELVWLTGVRNWAIDSTSGTEMSPEFLCHSNLSWSTPDQLERSTDRFRATPGADSRVMTLIQGQDQIELPPGFGIPMLAGEPLEFFTMVINKNSDELPLHLKVRGELEYRRQAELDEAIVPLFKRRLYNAFETPSDHGGMSGHHHGGHGETSQGSEAMRAAPSAMQHATLEWSEEGTRYGMHWLVPPGRHEYRTAVDDQFELPFDTTVHYVTAHLHPYGESIALRDVVSGETVFQLRAHPYADRLGIAEMESFSSTRGVRLARHGSYELVTVYDNPTDEPVDAMGILYLYLRDLAFELSEETS